jgi:hypothetical protein
MTRKYSSISIDTQLAAGGVSSTATSMTVTAATGAALMGGITLAAGNVDQFTVAIDPDTVNEEIVFITAQSSDTFTIVRGRAGTSNIVHASGAVVRHVLTSDDLNYYTTGVATADANIPKTIVTNKADIITATAASTPARIGAGSNDQVLTVDSTTATGLKWATPAVTTLNVTFNAQTGTTYTLVSGDVNKIVTLNNASAVTVTIPNGVFTTGQVINLQQIGAGQVTITGDGTTTFTGTGTKLHGRYSAAVLICTGTNTFTLIGDIV